MNLENLINLNKLLYSFGSYIFVVFLHLLFLCPVKDFHLFSFLLLVFILLKVKMYVLLSNSSSHVDLLSLLEGYDCFILKIYPLNNYFISNHCMFDLSNRKSFFYTILHFFYYFMRLKHISLLFSLYCLLLKIVEYMDALIFDQL